MSAANDRVQIVWTYNGSSQNSETMTRAQAQRQIDEEIKEQREKNNGKTFGTWSTVDVIRRF